MAKIEDEIQYIYFVKMYKPQKKINYFKSKRDLKWIYYRDRYCIKIVDVIKKFCENKNVFEAIICFRYNCEEYVIKKN